MLSERPSSQSPWTNVYGLARSTLALGTFITLASHHSDLLFRPMGGEVSGMLQGSGAAQWSLFNLTPPEHLEWARLFSVLVLLLVIIGWRPRITGVLHWWVSFSFASTAMLLDGGDHVAVVLSLLLLPITLTDNRRWHWSVANESDPGILSQLKRDTAVSAMWVIRLQVAIIYFHAGVAKLAVEEWVNGTALYYWFTNPIFGAPSWLEPVLLPLLTSPVGVTLLTWTVLLLEITLFLGLVIERRWRPALLVLGLSFHAGIILVHGLVSFFCSMAAALILYLRPLEQEFRIPSLGWWASVSSVLPRPPRRQVIPAG